MDGPDFAKTVPDERERREIELALLAYLAHPEDGKVPTDLAPIARRWKALPVYADMGGALFITTAGDVLVVDSNQCWDESTELEVEISRRWRAAAFITAAEHYPQLAFLRPPRPSSAVDCPVCHGTARILLGTSAEFRCMHCWAHGWIDETANPPTTPEDLP